MATLSPEEQKVFEALVAKQSAPVEEKLFSDAGDVLRYLVVNFPGFTAHPEHRQQAVDAVNATYPPAVSTADTTPAPE